MCEKPRKSEIAFECGISRQAVSTMLMRCRKMLSRYEDKLHLAARFQEIKAIAEKIESVSLEIEGPEAEEIRALTRRIVGEL